MKYWQVILADTVPLSDIMAFQLPCPHFILLLSASFISSAVHLLASSLVLCCGSKTLSCMRAKREENGAIDKFRIIGLYLG